MKDHETLQRFLVLRARNTPYAAIEGKLGVTKNTLIAWGRKHAEEIEHLRVIEHEALIEEYGLSARARVARFGTELRKVCDELATRDLTEIPTAKLYDLFFKLNAQMKNDTTPPVVRTDDEVQRCAARRQLLEKMSAPNGDERGATFVGRNRKIDTRDLIGLQFETYRACVTGELNEVTAIRRMEMLNPLIKAIGDAELESRLQRIERALAADKR